MPNDTDKLLRGLGKTKPKHTSEPWRVVHKRYIESENGDWAALVSAKNAPRIVACINACAGMEDPAGEIRDLQQKVDSLSDGLKQSGDTLISHGEAITKAELVIHDLRVQVSDLRAQRDDLVRIIKELWNKIIDKKREPGYSEIFERSRAAIAKCEEEENEKK